MISNWAIQKTEVKFKSSSGWPVITISLLMLMICYAPVFSQRSHYWVPDSAASRVDVDEKGPAPAKPLQPGGSDLTRVGQGEMDWNVADEFIPTWEKDAAGGDFDLSLEVAPQKDSSTWPEGGLIFTGDVNSASGIFGLVAVTPESGVVFNTNGSGGAGHKVAASPAVTLPVWIRLAKTGSVVTGYYKANENAQWVSLGSLDHGSSTPANPAVGKALFKPGSEL